MDVKIIRITSIVLACIGLVDSLYLTWVKVTNRYALCGPIGDCESVNSSRYSEIGGVPIALLGAVAYLIIIVLLVLETRGGIWMEYSPYVVLGITIAGSLYSVYLTYLEIAVIHAICPYCVVSAVVIIILFILSLVRLTVYEPEFNND
jgi:uncharacterized membrane protein